MLSSVMPDKKVEPKNRLLSQSLRCPPDSRPQNTKDFLRVESLDHLDIGSKAYF
jgi:hypothetical protein